jgi:ribosomal-protein-alanine N-acetyltransferase
MWEGFHKLVKSTARAILSAMTPTLETRRLVLRPLELADADQMQVIFPNWEIVQYLTSRVPWPYPPNGVETFYREVALPAIERGEEWDWTLN